jgi:hypothetical protein
MSIDAENWTAEQMRFIRWLALPKAERKPKYQRDLALEIGVVEDTLSRWKDLPGFRDAVNAQAREYVRDDIPEVLFAIRKAAKQGSVPHIQMALVMAGMAADVQAAQPQPTVKVYAGFDPADV